MTALPSSCAHKWGHPVPGGPLACVGDDFEDGCGALWPGVALPEAVQPIRNPDWLGGEIREREAA